MTKPDRMHCVIRIKPTGELVKMRRNLAHWGFWDTVSLAQIYIQVIELNFQYNLLVREIEV